GDCACGVCFGSTVRKPSFLGFYARGAGENAVVWYVTSDLLSAAALTLRASFGRLLAPLESDLRARLHFAPGRTSGAINLSPMRHLILPHLCHFLLLIIAGSAFAQEQSVKPGINEKFLDPALKVEEWTERFETE